MPAAQMAFVASIPWMAGLIGYIGGGIASDFIYKHGANKLRARKITTVAPLAIAGASLFLVPLSPSTSVAVSLISLAVMLLTASVQSCWATIHELVPSVRVGGVSGFIPLLSNISGIIGPAMTGYAISISAGSTARSTWPRGPQRRASSPWPSSSAALRACRRSRRASSHDRIRQTHPAQRRIWQPGTRPGPFPGRARHAVAPDRHRVLSGCAAVWRQFHPVGPW